MLRLGPLGLVLPIFLHAAPAAAQTASQADSLALPRRYVAWFWQGSADSLWSHMGDRLRAEVGAPGAIVARLLEVTTETGAETAVVGERLERRDGLVVYLRTMRLEKAPHPVVFVWELLPDGTIARVDMRPAS